MKLHTGVEFRHAGAFWAGVTCVSAGVLAHMPDYLAASSMRFRMVGMPMSALMHWGMALIVVGLALTAFGLIPAGSLRSRPTAPPRR
jgi:putative MFS transporter